MNRIASMFFIALLLFQSLIPGISAEEVFVNSDAEEGKVLTLGAVDTTDDEAEVTVKWSLDGLDVDELDGYEETIELPNEMALSAEEVAVLRYEVTDDDVVFGDEKIGTYEVDADGIFTITFNEVAKMLIAGNDDDESDEAVDTNEGTSVSIDDQIIVIAKLEIVETDEEKEAKEKIDSDSPLSEEDTTDENDNQKNSGNDSNVTDSDLDTSEESDDADEQDGNSQVELAKQIQAAIDKAKKTKESRDIALALALIEQLENGELKSGFEAQLAGLLVRPGMQMMGGIAQVSENGGTEILEDSSLTIEISKITNLLGQEFSDENPFDPNGEFKIHVDWELENGHGYEEGSQVTFTLTEELHFDSEINLELKDPSGDIVARVHIDTNNQVTMTFTDFVKNASDVTGQFEIIAKLDKSKTEEVEGNIIIGPIGEEGSLTLPISMLDREKDVQKQGHPERQYEAGYIDWEVTVNAGRVFLENASITDVLPEGVKYVPNTLKVFKQKVSVNDEVLGEEEVTVLNVSTDNGQISVGLGDINHQYVVRYQTEITDEDKKDFVNEVTFVTKNEPNKEAGATVTITRGEPLTKQAVPNSFDPKTGIIEWEIEFNYNKKSLNNEKLTDTWTVTPARNMTLVDGEVIFTEMQIDENGVATPTGNVGLPAGAELVETENGFEVTGITTDKPYKVTYKTQIEGRITDTINVGNVAGFGPHEVTGTGPGELGRYYGSKSAGTINYAEKTIDWTIQLNHDEYPMGNIVIEDTLGAGLTLVENSLVVNGQNENGNPVPMPQLSQNGQNFTLTFPADFVTKKMVTITYQTTFNPNEVPNYEPENSAVVKWTPGAEGSQQTGNVSAKTEFRPEVENYHWKNAYYDPATKEITWEMIVNYRENSFANLRIEDVLQGDQDLEPYEFEVHELNIDENGDYTEGNQVNSPNLTVTGKSFSLVLGETEKAYRITYKTSLAGLTEITQTYENVANVFDGTEKVNDEPLEASVGIYEEQKYADKSGNQENNSKFADWQIFVNIAQEKITGLKLTDTASRNQEYIEDTIKVYGVKYVDGKPVKDPDKELDPDEYTVTIDEFDYDNPNSKPSFVLEWKNDVEVTYVVEYSTLFFAGHGDSIDNTYKLEGNSKTLSDEDTSKGDSLVIRQTASGSASGKSGRLVVQKEISAYDFVKREQVIDDESALLEGIEFELYDVNSGRLVKKGITDENGVLDFGRLLYGNYKLVEVNVPEGYIAPDNNKIITINKEYSSALEDHTVEIENYEAIFAVELTKVDDVDSTKLVGAEFGIYYSQTDAQNNSNPITTVTTNSDGYAVFNLAAANVKQAGTYYVKEITPPQYYEVNDTIYTVTIGDKERTPVKVNNNGEIKNALIKGKGELRKIDAELSANNEVVGLQGATFVVRDENGLEVDRFTTGIDGVGLTTKGLRPGSYTVEEESAPRGFEKSDDTFYLKIPKAESEKTYNITATENGTQRVNVENEVKTTNIAITKENSVQRGNKISGVTFEITGFDRDAYDGRYNDIIDQYLTTNSKATTNNNGVATFENLPPGTYTIVESDVPAEYGFIPYSTSFTMTINYNQVDNKTTVSTTRTNKPLAKVTLRKVDSESNFRLQGVQFSLWKGETRITNHFGMKDAVYTTNSSGEIVITGLTPGDYELREVATIDGYTINDTNEQHIRKFTVPELGALTISNETEIIEFTALNGNDGAVGNKIVKGSVELTKRDGDDHSVFLDGVTFELKATELYNVPSANRAQFLADYNNQLQQSYTTANGGKIKITDLRPGKYTFTETQTITGYQPHTWGQPITFEISVSSNQVEQEVTVDNYKLVDIAVAKDWTDTGYDRPTEVEVALLRNGELFKTEILNEENDWSHTFEKQLAVDENGEKYTYTVDELNVPNGYAKSITGDVANGFTITNEALMTKIELMKTDSRTNVALAGATFDIRLKGSTEVISTKTTNASGELTFENLQPGVYELVETVAPAGYYQLTGPIEVTVERSHVADRTPVTIGVENDPYADVTLTKVDAETDVALPGAEFTIYDENDNVVLANIPVNDSGELRVTGLPEGSYVLKETKAPTGYVLSEEELTFTVTRDQDTEDHELGEFENEIERGSVSFTKKDDSGEPMAGVSFTIESTFLVNATEMFSTTVKTDQDGIFNISGLRPGTYKITETVPAGYQYIGGNITFDLKLDASNKNIVLADVINHKKVAIDVEKVWQDDDNATNARPDSVQVQLLQGDKAIGTPVTLNDTNDWKHTFTDLDAVDTSGNYYTYTVDEVEVPTGYLKAITGTMADGFTITNTRSENITISGEKTWEYGIGGEQYTPDEITVKLMKNNGTEEEASQTVQAPWTYEFTNVPRFDNDGVEIDYSIAEADVAGFTTEVDGYNIKNTQETIEVPVTKIWVEEDAQFRPDTITVQVKNGDIVVASHDLNSDETTHTFTNLPKYDKNGNEITYTVDEVTPTGYEKKVNGNEITNTQIVTEVPVTKKWVEEDAQFRPANVTIQLKIGNDVYRTHTLSGDAEAAEWSYTFENLPVFDKNGEAIAYTVDEIVPTGYTMSINDTEITNTQTTENIEVTKVWSEVNPNYRPDEITIELKIGDDVYRTHTLEGDTTTPTWTYTFENLPTHDANGEKIAYTIDEITPTGYDKSINGTEITNTQETIIISGEKTWQDEENTADRPEDITVQVLIKDTTTVVAEKVISAAKDESYTFENLPKYDKDGNEITYAINELNVPGYVPEIDGYDITNTRTDKTNISVTKAWLDEDENDRPDSITVQLFQSGTKLKDATIKQEDNWTYTFADLDQFDEKGQPYEYTVEEVNVDEKYAAQEPQWIAEDNGYTITNIRTGTTTIEGTKTWLDYNDPNRPKSIEIEVYRSVADEDREFVETITVESNGTSTWTYKEEYPAFNDEGKKYTYSVEEVVPEGYELIAQAGFDFTNVRIGTTEVSGKKTWEYGVGGEQYMPEEITIHLMKNEDEDLVDSQTVKAPWTYEFTDLPKYDENGVEIDYSIVEEEIVGFLPNYDEFNVTNVQETIEIPVAKVWEEVDLSDRPNTITIEVKNEKEVVDSIDLSSDKTDNVWSYTFENLPKYDANNEEIVYTVEEVAVENYDTIIEATDSGFIITNTQKTYAIGDYVWVDRNKDGIQDDNEEALEGVKVELYDRDGNKIAETETDENGHYIFDELPAGEYKVKFTLTEEQAKKYRFTKEQAGDDTTVDSDANEETGWTREIVLNDDNEYLTKDYDTQDFNATEGIDPTWDAGVIELVDISGTKTWVGDDEENRPQSITVKLYANGEEVNKLNVSGPKWTFTFEGLDKYDETGKEITYTVDEVAVNGYETAIDGYDITNTFIPEQPKKEDLEEKDEGGLLPKTATQIFSYIGLGLGLIALGLTVKFTRRRKNA